MLIAPLDLLEPELARYGDVFWQELRIAICRRLGLARLGDEADDALIRQLFGFLKETKAPFEAVMFDLYAAPARLEKALASPRAQLYAREGFAALSAELGKRKLAPEARPDHPYFQGSEPVTLVHDEIETLWAPIATEDSWALFEQKLAGIDRVRDAYGFAD